MVEKLSSSSSDTPLKVNTVQLNNKNREFIVSTNKGFRVHEINSCKLKLNDESIQEGT